MKGAFYEHPLSDGREWDCQCARCGSSYMFDDFYGDGCLSSAEWCDSHPLPGREYVKRGAVEWFTLEEAL